MTYDLLYPIVADDTTTTGGGGGGGGSGPLKSALNVDLGHGVTIGFNIGNANTLYAFWTNLFADLNALGLTWIRLNYSWRNIERTQGVYTWTVLDDAVAHINASVGPHGVPFKMLYCLRDAPTWALVNVAQKATSQPQYLPDPTLMAGFASAVVSRYNGGAQGHIDAIGYNEDFNIDFTPNTNTLTTNQSLTNAGGPYTSFAITAAAQSADPGTLIYFGGFSNTTDVATVSTAVAAGDTTVHINSFTPAVTYASGTSAKVGYIAVANSSPYDLYNPGPAGVRTGLKSQPARDGYFAAQVMLAVTPAIRAINATIPIGVPCMWWLQPSNPTGFPSGLSNMTAYLTQIYSTAGSVIDAYTFLDGHYYSNAVDPSVGNNQTSTIAQYMTDIEAVIAANHDTGRQFWLTEFGWQVPTDCSEAQQSANYTTLLNAVIPGTNTQNNKIFFFTLWYSTTPLTGSELVFWNGSGYSYRQAYFTLQAYIAAHTPTVTGGGGGGGGGGGTPSVTIVNTSSLFIIEGTLQIDKAIGRRSTASLSVLTDTNTHFQQYQQIQIFDQSNTLVFSGYLDTIKETKPGFQAFLVHELTCMDQRWIADKRLIFESGLAPDTTLAPSLSLAPGGNTMAKVYTNRPYDVIAYDIFAKYLAPEGVTMGAIFTGPYPNTTLAPSATLAPNGPTQIISSVTFNYPSVSQALDALVASASASGIAFYWTIDQNKQFWFVPYSYVVNSTVVDGKQIDQVNSPPYVMRTSPLFRNTQYVAGGTTNGPARSEFFTGDNSKRTWTLAWNVALQPVISVNNVGQSVGIEGFGTRNYYFKAGSNTITQDNSLTALTSSDELEVYYVPMLPNTSTGQNTSQVTAQAALDGTTGLVESVLKDTNITSNADGNIEANYLLNVYSPRGTQFVFNTLDSSYAPGQQITVTYAPFGFSVTKMLVESVHSGDQQDLINMWNTVTAVVGPFDTSWANFFGKVLLPAGISTANSISVGI